MTSRAEKFNKVLLTKQANLEQDIAHLEAELKAIGPIEENHVDRYTQMGTDISQLNQKEADIQATLSALAQQEQTALADQLTQHTAEEQIHANEIDRVEQVLLRWRDQNKARIEHLESACVDAEQRRAAHRLELEQRQAELDAITPRKREARLALIDNLIQQYKVIKSEKKVYTALQDQRLSLEQREAEHMAWVKGYEAARYAINQDYYAWLAEKGATAPEDLDRVMTLNADPRQDYQARYIQLDMELNDRQAQLKKIRRALSKLDVGTAPQLRKPRYPEFDALATESQELTQVIEEGLARARQYDSDCAQLAADLEHARLHVVPDEIEAARERAHKRLAITRERANQKYEKEMADLRSQREGLMMDLVNITRRRDELKSQLTDSEKVNPKHAKAKDIEAKLSKLRGSST